MKSYTLLLLLSISLITSSCVKTDNASNQELSAIYHALNNLYENAAPLAQVAYTIDSAKTSIPVSGDVYLSNFRKEKNFDTSSGMVDAKDSVDLVVLFTTPQSKDSLAIPCKITGLKYYKKDYDEYSGLWMQIFDGISYIDITNYVKNGIYYTDIYGESSVSLSTIIKNHESQ